MRDLSIADPLFFQERFFASGAAGNKASFMPANFSTELMCVCGRLKRTVASWPARVKRVSHSPHSVLIRRILSSGKSSLTKYLSSTTGVAWKVNTEEEKTKGEEETEDGEDLYRV